MNREAKKGQSGRTQEIQRLIGRALRAVVDMKTLGERQILIDCDVLQADGGTRTAAITGAFVALKQACDWAVSQGIIKQSPIRDSVAAISCGLVQGAPVLDLDYAEDSTAQADANFVITGSGGIVEIRARLRATRFPKTSFWPFSRWQRMDAGNSQTCSAASDWSVQNLKKSLSRLDHHQIKAALSDLMSTTNGNVQDRIRRSPACSLYTCKNTMI